MNWLKSRLLEPSTYAGLGLIAYAVGDHLAAGGSITGAVWAGLMAMLIGERRK